MATYKSEVLHRRYHGKVRPRSHYVLGRLPLLARLTPAKVANATLRSKVLSRVLKRTAGVDQRRKLPHFSEDRLPKGQVKNPDVWIWADSFTEAFNTDVGRAALRLFESMGLTAAVIPEHACCGLTWITTGQLSAAQRIVAKTVTTLHPYVASGVPVVGLEPSCLAALREDAPQLVADPRAVEVGAGVKTLAEFLTTTDYEPPSLEGKVVVAQPHCHQHAVLGWEADAALLARTGATVHRLGGCCGLAGNFGVEEGHYETSVAVAEHQLLPAIRNHPGAVILTDGFSCKTQVADLAGVSSMHLVELLARG